MVEKEWKKKNQKLASSWVCVQVWVRVCVQVCACVRVGDWGRGGMCEIEKENEMAGKEESMYVRMCVF